MNSLAKMISYLFIPQINLILSFYILSYHIYGCSPDLTFSMFVAALFGFILPVIFFIIMRFRGKIVDDDASNKKERTIPYFFGTVIIIFALFVSLFLKFHPLIIALWVSYLLISIMLLFINLLWKISAHSIGVAIPLSLFIFLFPWEYILFIPIVIAVSWSRLYQSLHSPLQVILGLLLGYWITSILLHNAYMWF